MSSKMETSCPICPANKLLIERGSAVPVCSALNDTDAFVQYARMCLLVRRLRTQGLSADTLGSVLENAPHLESKAMSQRRGV